MYVGHVGAALGGKRFAPAVALAVLVFFAYLPDWVDAALCVTGRYHDAQMLSHSVPAVLVLALVAAATQLGRVSARNALVVAAMVLSHVVLDYLTGIKPTWPNGPFIGAGIYRYPALDFVVEGVVIFAGWMLYRASLTAEQRRSNLCKVMLASLILMQAAIDAGRLLTPSVNKC